jgi:hypothetical protein
MAKKSIGDVVQQGGKAVYSGSATIGRIDSIVGLISAIIFSGFLFIGGIVIMVIQYPKPSNKNEQKTFPDGTSIPQQGDDQSSDSVGFNKYKYLVGSLMIIFAFIILGFAILNRYLAKNYKPYAALEGGGAIVSGFRRGVRV